MNQSTAVSWPDWETVRQIGWGSYGAVYEIRRDLLGRTEYAALKHITIPQSSSDLDELYNDGYDDESIAATFRTHLQSIVDEYSLMRRLNGCSNVVNCDDIRYQQQADGISWDIMIKMELLTPLAKSLKDPIPEAAVLQVGRDISRALTLCRHFDIVHRDIKPQNIFVSPLGDYKLGDFGIAKSVEKTMGGTKIGTYKYMAPEVYNNQPYGHAADIYSLGLVLYWMLNRRRMPFVPLPPEPPRARLEEEARNRRLSGEPLPPPADGSEALKAIVLRACAYDQKDRFRDAQEMLNALEELEWMQRQHPAAPPPPDESGTDSAGMPEVPPDEDPTDGPSFPERLRRSRTSGQRQPTEEAGPEEPPEPDRSEKMPEDDGPGNPPEEAPLICLCCGKTASPGSKFCPNCGLRLSPVFVPPQPEPAAEFAADIPVWMCDEPTVSVFHEKLSSELSRDAVAAPQDPPAGQSAPQDLSPADQAEDERTVSVFRLDPDPVRSSIERPAEPAREVSASHEQIRSWLCVCGYRNTSKDYCRSCWRPAPAAPAAPAWVTDAVEAPEAEHPTPGESGIPTWTCSCGYRNTASDYCHNCWKPAPYLSAVKVRMYEKKAMAQTEPPAAAPPSVSSNNQEASRYWTCECGCGNSAKRTVCYRCGKKRP